MIDMSEDKEMVKKSAKKTRVRRVLAAIVDCCCVCKKCVRVCVFIKIKEHERCVYVCVKCVYLFTFGILIDEGVNGESCKG